MQATVRWTGPDGMSFLAETGSGHLVAMDGAPDGGGRNLAPRPMEMVLLGAGGCTAYDVVLILKRGRHDVRGCEVRMEAERAVRLSHEKYCSATAMLGSTAEIVTRLDVLEDA